MEIKRFEFNPFGENTYVIWNPKELSGAIIDPGMLYPHEYSELLEFTNSHKIELKFILLTHAHADHIFGASILQSQHRLPVVAHKNDIPLALALPRQIEQFHLKASASPLEVDKIISDENVLYLDDEAIKVLHTPGHTQGGVCYYVASNHFVITGDTLFNASIGRTDLPGGNYSQLISSIQKQLLTLPDDTIVYPGHGSATTIGREKQQNPFL